VQSMEQLGQQVVEKMIQSGRPISRYVSSQAIPKPFHGRGPVRLIILGQDPTVKNAESRKHVCTVLNLDKSGNLRGYIDRICKTIGISAADNLYATNVFKNFFTQPPTTIKAECDIFHEAGSFWMPVLRDELATFPGVPILSLGEPLLNVLIEGAASRKVRDYWGFTPTWKMGQCNPFRHVAVDSTVLGRPFFPFPHQPSLQKQFYRERLDAYLAYMRQTLEIGIREAETAKGS